MKSLETRWAYFADLMHGEILNQMETGIVLCIHRIITCSGMISNVMSSHNKLASSVNRVWHLLLLHLALHLRHLILQLRHHKNHPLSLLVIHVMLPKPLIRGGGEYSNLFLPPAIAKEVIFSVVSVCVCVCLSSAGWTVRPTEPKFCTHIKDHHISEELDGQGHNNILCQRSRSPRSKMKKFQFSA